MLKLYWNARRTASGFGQNAKNAVQKVVLPCQENPEDIAPLPANSQDLGASQTGYGLAKPCDIFLRIQELPDQCDFIRIRLRQQMIKRRLIRRMPQ